MTTPSDLVHHLGLFSTLERTEPTASAVAVTDRKPAPVATTVDVMPLAGPATHVIDLAERRVLPGLVDNHRAGSFASQDVAPPSPAIPDPSPVRHVGGCPAWRDTSRAVQPVAAQRTFALDSARRNVGVVRGHHNAIAWSKQLPIADLKSFSAALGCSC
jgi:hypothetical protein